MGFTKGKISIVTPETHKNFDSGFVRLPSWFKQEVPDMNKITALKEMFRGASLNTVCESAKCPNMGTCWKAGVATFMILGGTCTRACRFCAVPAGRPDTLNPHEPDEVAEAVLKMRLSYVVITSVARDDLDDEGVDHFVQTIQAVRRLNPQTKIEVLIPDFSNREELLVALSHAAPEVISHNIECVRRLSPSMRPQANHDRSLDVLKNFKRLSPQSFIKTSFMVGAGETDQEIEELIKEVVDTGCHILTIGQYLAPTQLKRHFRVQRFVTPEQFERYAQMGYDLGLSYVESGPLVRSSFIAEKGYSETLKRSKVN